MEDEALKLTEAERNEFKRLYQDWSGNAATTSVLQSSVPRFYTTGAPAEDETLAHKLREEARSRFLQRKSKELLDNNEMKEVWCLLDQNNTPPTVDDDKMIGYADFKRVASAVPAKARPFLTATVFGKLQQRDSFGRVSITTLFNYIMRKTWLRQSRLGLSLYDIVGQGYLTEKDLDLYITELIPTMAALEKLEESFHSFYTCTAVRKFLFFLDSKRMGRVRIVDILASGFLDDLLELRDAVLPGGSSVEAQGSSDVSSSSPRGGAAAAKNLLDNWFSAENALRVYGIYLNLDTDRNGMLSRNELKEYGGGSLTDAFIDRVFQECLTYEKEIDYKGYLDFVLAMENKKDRASLEYFFRILDVRQKGYIDAFAINYFFRDIQKQLPPDEGQFVEYEDIKDEIFDMVKPKHPLKITLQDLIACKQGDTVVSVLTDLDGFFRYENREYLATEPDDEEGASEDDDTAAP